MASFLHRRGTWAAAAVGAAAALLAPGAAQAATLTAEPSPRDPTYETIAHYVAAPGEVNRLLVTRVDDYTIRVSDSGATIQTGGRCTPIDAHTAQCTSPGPNAGGGPNWFLRTEVAAGDMDDEISSQGVGLDADGGAGSDSIAVDAVIASTLDGGGGGRDVLLGGENSDTLSDGDPSGATDGDLLDGREGGDTVSYAQRAAPVNVDLADDGPDGEAGEADELRSIESAEGGAGADVLSGTDDSNSLDGGAGDDRLTSGAGGDFLHGGDGEDVLRAGRGDDTVDGDAGNDRLFGERGNDVLLPRSRGDDAVSCGSGADIAAGPRRGDRLAADCEELRFSYGEEGLDQVATSAYPIQVSPASAVWLVGCPSFEDLDGESRAITATVRLREASGRGRLLGRGEISRRTGRRCADESGPGRLGVRVRLTRLGRGLASSPTGSGVLATVSLRGRNLPSVAWTIRLQVPHVIPPFEAPPCSSARAARSACEIPVHAASDRPPDRAATRGAAGARG